MNPLYVIYGFVSIFVFILISITIFLVITLKRLAVKNMKLYENFANAIIASMIGGLLVVFATELKDVSPFSISGIIFYSGFLFSAILLICICFSIILLFKKRLIK